MNRDNKGQFVKGHKGYKFWANKKRGETPSIVKEKISKSLVGIKRSKIVKEKMSSAKVGKNNPSWKGGRMTVKSGHILILQKSHPFCNTNGRVFEHRLVIEKSIGRYLTKTEHIHHIDCDPSNNEISNLVITSNSENSKAHGSLNYLVKKLIEDDIIVFNKIKKIYERKK